MTDLFHSNKIYYITLDSEGKFVCANNFFKARFFFLPKFETSRFCQIIYPDDIYLYSDAAAACLVCPEKRHSVLLRMLKKDGSYSGIDWEFFARLDGAGNITGISGLGFETLQAEFNHLSVEMQLRSLRLLSDNSSDGILLLNKEYKIISYNRPAENWSLELYKKQYLTGDDFRDYVREEALVYFYRQFDKALNGIITEEIFELDKNDKKVIFKVQMTPVYDENDDAVSGVAVITKDITLMQSLNKRLDEITAIQSHQIRRPVANMLSLVNLIEDGNPNEEQKEYLQLLKISIDQLEKEIQSIVKTARNI